MQIVFYDGAAFNACRADQHWQHAVYRHVLQCWQDKAARGAVKWQSLAKALCFNKQQLLSKAVQGWQEAMQQQQEERVAAEHAFQGVARHLELQGGADALWAWLEAAQLQGQRRQLLLEVAAARQQRTRQQVRASFLWGYCRIADTSSWLSSSILQPADALHCLAYAEHGMLLLQLLLLLLTASGLAALASASRIQQAAGCGS